MNFLIVIYWASVFFLGIGGIAESKNVMAFGFLIGGIAGSVSLYQNLLLVTTNWSVLKILANATIVSYFLTSAFTLSLASEEDLAFYTISGNFEPLYVFLAGIWVLVFAAALFLIAPFDRAKWSDLMTLLYQRHTNDGAIIAIVTVVALSQLFVLINNDWGFRGILTTDINTVPILVSFLNVSSIPILGVCGYVVGERIYGRRRHLIFTCLAAIPIELVWHSLAGRRILLYQVVVLTVGYLIGRGKVISFFKMIMIAPFALAAVFFGANIFISMRFAGHLDPSLEKGVTTTTTYFTEGFEFIRSSGFYFLSDVWENIIHRGYIMGYLASIIENTKLDSFLFGQETGSQFLISIPRLIFPGKGEFIENSNFSEYLINPAFDLVVQDSPSSIVVNAYVDFFVFGLIVLPVVVLAISLLSYMLIRNIKNRYVFVYFLLYLTYVFLNVEQSLGFYIAAIRNFALLSVLAHVILFLFARGSAPTKWSRV